MAFAAFALTQGFRLYADVQLMPHGRLQALADLKMLIYFNSSGQQCSTAEAALLNSIEAIADRLTATT